MIEKGDVVGIFEVVKVWTVRLLYRARGTRKIYCCPIWMWEEWRQEKGCNRPRCNGGPR